MSRRNPQKSELQDDDTAIAMCHLSQRQDGHTSRSSELHCIWLCVRMRGGQLQRAHCPYGRVVMQTGPLQLHRA